MTDYNIRLERSEDYYTVENLVREAFWNVYRPGCMEHYVLHCFRNRPEFVKELDFILESKGKIIAQVMFVKAQLRRDDGKLIPILTFGPIGVLPQFKRHGWGKILLDYALQQAEKMGFGAVCMEGNIDFYKHCGFDLASKNHIHYEGMPREDKVEFFLCKELKGEYLKANLEGQDATYSTPQGYFVDEKDVEEFDKTFEPKEKLKLPGQLFQRLNE